MTGVNKRSGRTRNAKLNIALATIIVLAAVGAFAAVRLLGASTSQDTAQVVVKDADGTEYELPLSQNAKTTVKSSAGTNVVQVKNGRVRVLDADCPNQDCVHQGWISTSGQQIVCLPHKLTVDIVDENGSADGYDVVGR